MLSIKLIIDLVKSSALYYGENYFGPVAKQDVKTMVHEMIGVYQERITDNTWLKEKTKEKAIKKIINTYSTCWIS